MNNRTLSLLAAVLLSSALSSHAQVFDEAALAAARSAGASAAAGGNSSFQIGPDGKPVLGPDGKPVMQQNSASSMADSLRMFQDMTGTRGVEQVSSPSQAARTGMVRVNLDQSFTFNCRLTAPGRVFSLGSLAMRLSSCELEAPGSPAVKSVTLSVCDAPTRAGTCATDADYSKPLSLPAGQYTSFSGLSVGLGCNSVSECQVSVKGSYAVGGSDASLKAQTQDISAGSNFIGDLRKVVEDGTYTQKMVEIGRPLADCAAANRDNTNGQVTGCDEGATAVKVTAPSSTCNTTSQCLREAVSVQRFERVCERHFPITERQTQQSFDKTLTCEMEVFSDGKTPTKNSCATPENPDPTAGYTKVGQTEPVCAVGSDNCASKTHTEYWVDTNSVTILREAGNPAAVGGACDTRVDSPTTFTTCDAWFGRTLDAASCTGVFTDESTGLPSGGGLGLDFTDRAGCGFCVKPTVGVSCYATNNPSAIEIENGADGADSCASMDLSACTFSSAQPMSFTSPGGLVMAQREVYTCKTESRQCVEWSAAGSDPACLTSDIAMGTDKMASYRPGNNETLNAALIAAATLNATAGGLEGSDEKVPKLFSGSDMRCSRPAGGLGSILSRNCCRTDLERPKKGNIIRSGCSFDEAKLAAARRSSYATYIGEYCSKKFLKKCLRYTQTYCVFDGILPRLVQEQGRGQLAQITASSVGDSVQRGSTAFNYLDTESGKWSAPTTVNGVTVTAWQWPAYCATSEKAYQQLVNAPDSNPCPGVVSTWFAACDVPSGCGALPVSPEEGSLLWSLSEVNPLEQKTSAISRFAVVTGACSTSVGSCSYEIAAWPVGTGGRAVVTRDLTWPLFSETQQESPTSGKPSAQEYQLSNIGDLMFKGYSLQGAVGGAQPSTVRLDLSRDGGQTWATYNVATGQKSVEQTLVGDVKVIGSCDAATNVCTFRATGTTTVSAKPWGWAGWPDCSGFTAGQLSVLDFSKMDLSEWLSTVMDKVNSGVSTAALAEQAATQFAEFNSLFQQGKVRATAPVGANFARAVPAEGFGPFTVKLAVSGVWPEVTGDPAVDTNTVLGVDVDWGDCSDKETLLRVEATEGNGFRGVHRYLGPADKNPDTGSYQHSCLASKYAGNLERNLIHEVKLTIRTLKSGVQTRTLKVENAWARYPGATDNNVGVEIETTGVTEASKVPAPPRP